MELGNRKRTILFSPNPSLHLSSLSNRRRSGCPPRRKPSFYVFVLLSFSDTLYPQTKSNRTEPNEHYRDDRIRRRPGPITPSPYPELDAIGDQSDGANTTARKRPLSSKNPGAFLSQLRSGSHNQPSFCVFLLFFSYFYYSSAASNAQSYANDNKHPPTEK